MVNITLITLLGKHFATKTFKSDDYKSQRRWIERQELKYGAGLSRQYNKVKG